MSGYGYNPPAFPPLVPAVPDYGRLPAAARPTPASIFATPLCELQALAASDGTMPGPFDAALASLRNDRLIRLAGQLGMDTPSDAYLLQQLLAAERQAEREMRIFFTPREVIPVGTPIAEVAALTAAGVAMVEEPGYPYDTGLFNGMDLEVRHRPIINIYRLWYTYQGEGTPTGQAAAPLYDIPMDWIQVDRKYGKINLLPSSTFTNLPLNTFLLSTLGAGRDIPFGLKLRYSAGLVDARNDYPDLLVLILRMAVISIMDDSFLPQSGSISADGLSESMSRDVDKYRGAVSAGLAKIASSIKGIRMVVL